MFAEAHEVDTKDTMLREERATHIDLLNVLVDKNRPDDECAAVLAKLADREALTKMVGLLVVKSRFSLVDRVISERLVEFDPRFVQIAIEQDAFDSVFLLRDTFPRAFVKSEREFIPSVFISFTNSNTCWLAKCTLFKSVIDHISYRKAEEFLFTLANRIGRKDPKDSPLYFAPNVLLLILNLYEICMFLQKSYPFLSGYTKSINSQLTEVASNFIAETNDEEKLRALIFEKDFENRDSLSLVSAFNITDIMNNKNMEKIALELWESEYDVKGNLLE